MKAVRIYGARDVRVESIPKPVCEPGKVLIRTLYCGVCGSDVPRTLEGHVSIFPASIGHEFSAIVEEVGEGVTGFSPGDLVVLVPLIVCHECLDCKNGNFGQCSNCRFIGGSVPDTGGFIEYNLIDPRNLLKMPQDMNPLHAAFVEPLSVALHGLFLMGFKAGKEIAVVGAGTIGLLVVQAAKALGAGPIYVFDINQGRLDRAKQFGTHAVFNTSDEKCLEKFMEMTNQRGVDQVVEAVGVQDTIELSMRIAGTGANVSIIGGMHSDIVLSPRLFYGVFSRRQLNLHGVWMSYSANFPGEEWRVAAQQIAKNEVNVEPLIYDVCDIDKAYEAISGYDTPNKVTGKIMLRMTP